VSEPAPSVEPIKIRPMRLADLDLLMPYEDELFGSEAWSRQSYIDELADTELRDYLVAEAAGQLVGSGGVLTIAETAQILTVGVLPFARRRGIGAVMVQALVARARQRRAEEVLLEVRVDNEAAQKLYEKAGFSPLGLRRGYYDHGRVDALVMRLGLADG
jgi:ribosomal-protein-alanine N-acetyltransferase